MGNLPDSTHDLTSYLFEITRVQDLGWTHDEKTREVAANLIKNEGDPHVRQRIFNLLFPTSNRELAVSKASEDVKGRKVRYYRSMSIESFLKLMEVVTWDSKSISDDETVNQDELLVYLYNLTRWTNSLINVADFTVDNTKNHLRDTFPDATDAEIEHLLATKNYAEVRSFLSRFANPRALRSMHRSFSTKFNPYFSCSAGGPSYTIGEGVVCLEMVIPDDEVEADLNAFEGEKEVYLRQLDLRWITRVFGAMEEGNQQWTDEVIYNPDLPLGQYSRYKFNFRRDYDEIAAWTKGEPTKDCLPIGLKVL